MNRTEFYHSGTKGMKWGVRRYQNKDGTLTEAGKKRYARDAREQNWTIGQDGVARSNSKKSQGEIHEADPNKWVNEDVERSRRVVDSTSNLNRELKNVNDRAIRNSKRTRMDLSNMSDQDLRNKINRELLERQYNDVFNPPKVSKGRAVANAVMENAGSVLAITSSALGIALAIRQLTGGSTTEVKHSEELYHHGIKGQKWGIRRFQNKNGSLTAAGKKRYLNDVSVKSAKESYDAAKKQYKKTYHDYNRAVTIKESNRLGKQLDQDKQNLSASKFRYKTDKEVARIRYNNVEFKNKSKHRLKLEEQYKKLGLNDEQAQAAANNRIRTEKILVASAALTVTACALYYANGKRKEKIDGIIKAGDKLQRIEMSDTNGKLHDVFYVSQGKHDNKRYEGLLGMVRKNQTGHAYKMSLEAAGDIKVASKDKARKVFEDLYRNDADFRNAVKGKVGNHFAVNNRPNLNRLNKRDINRMYENFNTAIVDMNGQGAHTKFYDALKKQGYGAIQDINDMKFSGYNAKNPLIVFDNSNNNITVRAVSEMKGNLVVGGLKEYAKASLEGSAKKLPQRAMVGAAGAAAAAGYLHVRGANENTSAYKKTSSSSSSNAAVKAYRDEHPGTKMTDTQIAEMLKKEK